MKILFALAAATMAFSGAAAEEIGYAKDALAYSAMINGDWSTAEAQLAQSGDELSSDPAYLLNLAQLYLSTNRTAEADAVYRRVLSNDDMILVLSDGRKVTAHSLASSRLSRVQQAAR